jgi:hypothetical protein
MRNLSENQFGKYEYDFEPGDPNEYGEEAHRVTAVHSSTNKVAGTMEWDPVGGHILQITTFPEHTRKGVATGMWLHANAQKGIVKPIHSNIQSKEGKAWADSL